MDAQQQSVFRLVDDAHALFQVGYFFLGDGLPFRVDGRVRRADHPGVIAQQVEQVI